jgi:hypothetical protein
LKLSRPEVKENKEGADTEKAAEEEKESDKELVKEKVSCKRHLKLV